MKRPQAGALLLVILASGWWLWRYYSSQPAPGVTIVHRMAVACAACGRAYDGMLGDPPGTCHFCKQQTLWPALKCRACKTIFPMTVKPVVGQRPSITCTKCGKADYTEVEEHDVQKP